MKLNHKIEVDILEFILTGKFDYLEIGQTKEWITSNFPDPDDFSVADDFDNAAIWRYGNIELHFDNRRKLFLIYSDYIGDLAGGNGIDLNPWILNTSEEINLEVVLHELNKLKIDYSVTYDKVGRVAEIQIKKSKVKLLFDDEDIKNCYQLRAFSLM